MEVDFKDVFIRPLNNSFTIPEADLVYLTADYTVKEGGTAMRSRRDATLAYPPMVEGGRLTIPAFWLGAERRGDGRAVRISLLDASGKTEFSRSIIAGDELPLVVGLPNFGAGNHLLRVGSGPNAYSGMVRTGD
jgi:hypothetical protein